MKSGLLWFGLAALVGLAIGAMTGTPPAHACSCADRPPIWDLGELQVETADPKADDARFWNRDGRLLPGTLTWESDTTPSFISLEFGR